MPVREIHLCQCPECQQEAEHPDRAFHQQINLVMSRFDEQQRRWFAAVESNRIGRGGDTLLSQITGLDEKTIHRGRQELTESLSERPPNRIRLPGAGRPSVKKKIRR